MTLHASTLASCDLAVKLFQPSGQPYGPHTVSMLNVITSRSAHLWHLIPVSHFHAEVDKCAILYVSK